MKRLQTICKLASLLVIFLSYSGVAQEKSSSNKNALYLEVTGGFADEGLSYTISYDRLITLNDIHKISISAGCGILPSLAVENSPIVFISPQVSYLLGRIHHLEIGTGLNTTFYPINGYETDTYVYDNRILLRIGYRYQNPEKRLFYKVAYTPNYKLTNHFDNSFDIAWFSTAIGFTF